nr:sensor domain-containing diguanylate cyclase [Acinetobacter sp. Marseille-Q1620]
MFEHSQHDLDSLIDEHQLVDILKKTETIALINLLSEFPIPTAILSIEGRFISSNQLFSDIYQSDALFLHGKLLSNFVPEMSAYFEYALSSFSKGKKHLENELYYKGHFLNAYFKPLKNEQQEIEAILIVYVDITHLKRRERVLELSNKKLQEDLYLDRITGLKNKLSFSEFFQQRKNLNSEEKLSFLKMDLDDYKKYNQMYSYTQGDIGLLQIANLLKDFLIDDDIQIFRFDSASFTIVLENQSEWHAMTLAERLKQFIYERNLPFEYSETSRVTVSIGVLHTSMSRLANEGSLLQQLDLAVRQAKAMGKNQISLLKTS